MRSFNRTIGKIVGSSISFLDMGGFVLGGVALIMIVSVTVFGVIMRQVFGLASTDVVVLGRIAMIFMGFMVAGYVMRQGRHIAITSLTSHLPPVVRRWVTIVALCVSMVALVLIIVLTFQFAWFRREIGAELESIWSLKSWPFQMLIPAGLVILFLESIRQLVKRIQAAFRNEDLPEPKTGHEPVSGEGGQE